MHPRVVLSSSIYIPCVLDLIVDKCVSCDLARTEWRLLLLLLVFFSSFLGICNRIKRRRRRKTGADFYSTADIDLSTLENCCLSVSLRSLLFSSLAAWGLLDRAKVAITVGQSKVRASFFFFVGVRQLQLFFFFFFSVQTCQSVEIGFGLAAGRGGGCSRAAAACRKIFLFF